MRVKLSEKPWRRSHSNGVSRRVRKFRSVTNVSAVGLILFVPPALRQYATSPLFEVCPRLPLSTRPSPVSFPSVDRWPEPPSESATWFRDRSKCGDSLCPFFFALRSIPALASAVTQYLCETLFSRTSQSDEEIGLLGASVPFQPMVQHAGGASDAVTCHRLAPRSRRAAVAKLFPDASPWASPCSDSQPDTLSSARSSRMSCACRVGLPPPRPFLREARAFSSDFAEPPLLPICEYHSRSASRSITRCTINHAAWVTPYPRCLGYPKRAQSPQDRVQVVDLDPVPKTFAAAPAP